MLAFAIPSIIFAGKLTMLRSLKNQDSGSVFFESNFIPRPP